MKYHVWVLADNTGRWERYTANGFYSKALAEDWMHAYIPHARAEIRKAAA